MTGVSTTTIRAGERAPAFAVPAVHDDRLISLDDYRGRAPLLLGLFPGLYCPFCRRALKQMAGASQKLMPLGIESLAIVGTELENARLYFRYRPTPLPLAADPQLMTHRLFGVPKPALTPELVAAIAEIRINPYGDLPAPLPVAAASDALNAMDSFVRTATDERDLETSMTQLKGQFLIDRDGVVRWANVECETDGLSGIGKFPTHDELLTAARLVAE